MADYYPLLARALDAMPDRSPALRQAVYERARGALIGQLRSLDPPLSEDDIDLERNALEAAILRLERDHGGAAAAAPEPAADPEPPAPEPDPSAATPGQRSHRPARAGAARGALGRVASPSRPRRSRRRRGDPAARAAAESRRARRRPPEVARPPESHGPKASRPSPPVRAGSAGT